MKKFTLQRGKEREFFKKKSFSRVRDKYSKHKENKHKNRRRM